MSIKLLGIPGSLRAGSFNRSLIRAAASLLPEDVTMETFDLKSIPLYDGDVEAKGLPEPVVEFRRKIKEADALLIATPEYNYSIPGVLKNAIDWASRPPDQPIAGKPIALMGASPGMLGTARCQHHLRLVLAAIDGRVVTKPEVLVASAQNKINDAGELTDAQTRELIQKLLAALKEWTLMHRQAPK